MPGADMERALPTPAEIADAAAVTEIVGAMESSLYGRSTFSQADLEGEWSELDLQRDARVVRDGGRVVGYGVVRERGERWEVEAYVHPHAVGRCIGRLIAAGLEEDAARGGARRIQNSVLEADSAARRLLESLGYESVRVFREMRIELEAPPPAPEWPDGLHVVPFDPDHDAREFHAAQQEAFADHWDYSPRDFETWSKATSRATASIRRSGASCAPGMRSRGRNELHGRHPRRRLRPRALHASPLAQAGRGRGAARRRVRTLLGAR